MAGTSASPVTTKYPFPSVPVLGGLILVAAALSIARVVFIPIALAILLSFVLTPFVILLQRQGLPRPPAVIIVTLVTLIAVIGITGLLVVQFEQLVGDLNDKTENIKKKIESLIGGGSNIITNIVDILKTINEAISPEPDRGETAESKEPDQELSGTDILSAAGGALFGILGTVGLTVALTVAMLFKREDLRNRLIRLAGHGQLTTTTRVIDEATRRISRFLVIQVSFNAAFGIMIGLGCLIFQIPYPLLWAFLAAVIRFIPYIGTWLGGSLPLFVSIAFSDTWTFPVLFLIYLIILGIAINNLLEPMLLSQNIGLSPVALIIAAAFWTWMWGPIGLVLATPLTVCLSVLGRYVPPLAFFDVLVGTEPALDPQYGFYQRLLARDEGEAADLMETYLEDHTLEEMADEMIVPMLVRTGEDQAGGKLRDEDLEYIYQTTDELIRDQEINPKAARTEETLQDPDAPLVIGFPTRPRTDVLALRLFRNILAPLPCRMEVLSSEMTSAEVLERLRKEEPKLIIISSVPPGGLAKTRYLCKRLRHEFPHLSIMIGAWGIPENNKKLIEKMQAAGATHVAMTLSESREQVVPLLEIASSAPESSS